MRLDTFLECFFPTDTEPMYVRGLSPKELPEPQREPVFGQQINRRMLVNNRELQNTLKALNKKQGIYFVPNSGGFKDLEIVRHNAVFCEMDNLPIQAQHDLYDMAPLPPSIRVETKKSVHAYWLLSENGSVTREAWHNVQCGLINHFKSDGGIKNPNRVMRLPFFNHLSWDGTFHYKRVEVNAFSPDTRFKISELREAYPFTPPAVPIAKYNGHFDNTIEGIAQELRFRISQHPTYKIEPDKEHAVCQGICHHAIAGKTALMVNLRTGAVFCHAGCDYWVIAQAFGLQKPTKNGHFTPRLIKRETPQAATGKRLMNYVYGGEWEK